MRNTNLDGVRGLAALAVAFGHANTSITGLEPYLKTAADFGSMTGGQIAARLWHVAFPADAAVLLFFVLSGWVLSRALEARADRPGAAALPYLVRRIFRLYPVAIVSAVPLVWLAHMTPWQTVGTMLLFDRSVNGVIWSLQVELAGSALVFLLWAVGSRWFALAVIAALAVAIPVVEQHYMVLFLPAFVLGYLIPAVPYAVWRSRALLMLSVVALMAIDLLIGKSLYAKIIEGIAAMGVVGCLSVRSMAWLDSRPVQFLGDMSYPFYLMHMPALIVTHSIIKAALGGAPAMLLVLATAVVSTGIALAGAWVVHYAAEMPGIRLGNRFVRWMGSLRPATAA